ncbi:MAG: helix-turn-helix transcriptional regulator [Verrucomicrobiae bacterium]|nr:helix-turn-helix transcriptional regulator [Verrucomicrobiae bacterium]MCP5544700.1 helix-turn-helix transcriptional regulator [Akkermansiaceae bacterium]
MKTAVTRRAIELKSFAPEAMKEVIDGGNFEHYVLGSTACHFAGRQWTVGSFSVNSGRYSFPCRVLGAFPRNLVTIGFTRRMSAPGWFNGFEVHGGQMQIIAEGGEANMYCAPDAHWVAMEMERDELQAVAWKHLGRELDLPRRGTMGFDVPSTLLAELDRLIMVSLRPDSDALSLRPAIVRAVVELLASHDTEILRATLRRHAERNRRLADAERYLRRHMANEFDADAFASAMGRSERSLQLLFKEAYGITPQQWARCLGLHMARRALQRIDPRLYTIQAVAEECGFHHMGRFSRYYQDLFGESPSVTLADR